MVQLIWLNLMELSIKISQWHILLKNVSSVSADKVSIIG